MPSEVKLGMYVEIICKLTGKESGKPRLRQAGEKRKEELRKTSSFHQRVPRAPPGFYVLKSGGGGPWKIEQMCRNVIDSNKKEDIKISQPTNWAVVAHTFNPSTRTAEASESL